MTELVPKTFNGSALKSTGNDPFTQGWCFELINNLKIIYIIKEFSPSLVDNSTICIKVSGCTLKQKTKKTINLMYTNISFVLNITSRLPKITSQNLGRYRRNRTWLIWSWESDIDWSRFRGRLRVAAFVNSQLRFSNFLEGKCLSWCITKIVHQEKTLYNLKHQTIRTRTGQS